MARVVYPYAMSSTAAATNTAATQPPEDYAESVVRASGTSFYWAMRRLPAEKRAAMYAIYAFCRVVDDIADEPGEETEKRRQLDQWRDEVARLFAGAPETPVGRALAAPVEAFGLRQQDFIAVIAGMEMDAGARLRITDREELTLYCDRVASAVGRLSTRVFGLSPDQGEALAAAQGQALQLTNILRDIDEDARRDRLYLPADRLRAQGIDPEAGLETILGHPNLHEVCMALAEEARRHFAAARTVIAGCNRDDVRPAVMMLEVYGRIFEELQRTGWRNPRRRVRLSPMMKLWILLRYGLV